MECFRWRKSYKSYKPTLYLVHSSGSKPVAPGPKVARQVSKSGPQPPKEF